MGQPSRMTVARTSLWKRFQLTVVFLLMVSGIAFAFQARALACGDLVCGGASDCNGGTCCANRGRCDIQCSPDRSGVCTIESGLCCRSTILGCVCGACASCNICPPCGV